MNRTQATRLYHRINRQSNYNTVIRAHGSPKGPTYDIECVDPLTGIPFVVSNTADWKHRLADAINPY